MRPRALIVAALSTVGLAAAPIAAAKPTAAVPIGDDALAVAYAPGRVLVAEPDPFVDNLLVVRELRFADRSNRVVVEIPVSDDTSAQVGLAANATGYLIVLHDDRERLIVGGYDGSLRVLSDCADESAGGYTPTVTAGTSGFAFANAHCPGVPDAAVIGADGAVTPFAGAGVAYSLAYAEPFLATGALGSVTVTDLASGAARSLPPLFIGPTGTTRMVAGGTLVFAADEFDGLPKPGLYVWPPGAQTPTRLDERVDAVTIAEAGGRIVYGTSALPRIVGLGGGPSRALILPGAGSVRPLGFDGRQAAFDSRSCSGERQVAILDVDAPREPRSVGGCPVRFTRRAVRFDRTGRARVSVACANGCHGFLDLRQRETRRHPCPGEAGICANFAVAQLDLPPSTRPRRITLQLTEAGRRQRGRSFATETILTDPALTHVGEIRRARL